MTWGANPTSSGGSKREVPYLPYSNSTIKRFAPLAGENYHCTIPTSNGWDQPVEIWTHNVTKNGKFFGTFFSRNTKAGDNKCPFAYANMLQLQRNGGMPIDNKNREYPLGKRFVFPIVVDEIPNESFLLYMISEREKNAIMQSFSASRKSPLESKIIISRVGSGQQTAYNYQVNGEPVNKTMLQNLQLPHITPDTYKEFLLGLENLYAPEFGLNLVDPTSTGTQQQTSQQNQPNTPFHGGIEFANQQDTKQASSSGSVAENFVLEFGPLAGKKLGDLDNATLETIANAMDGDIQEYAVQILNSRK